MNFNKVIFRDCNSGTSAHFNRLHVRSSMKSTLDFPRANTDAENRSARSWGKGGGGGVPLPWIRHWLPSLQTG